MKTEEFDAEWMNLIMSARKLGLTLEDIRAFLRSPYQPMKNPHISTATNTCTSP
ncbi:DNA-binding anti-repressor SinI [Paenibacillus sp. N3.4]|nr:DNA-binding anti-repressor SinI [Paenibacillus sp. N3.4]